MQTDLRAAHVILEDLLDDVDVPPPPLQARQRLVDIRARPLDDEGTEAAEDMLEIGRAPHLGLAHRLYEISAGEQRDTRLHPRLAVGAQDAALRQRAVNLRLEMVEDLGGGDVIGLKRPETLGEALSACGERVGGVRPTLKAS